MSTAQVKRPKTAVVAVGERIPVTIVTGYLGAGKTTLVNHILQKKGQKRVAVIENEFGEINIDNSLVAANLIEKEDLISLDNGCVCCSLRKDVVKALAELERRSRVKGERLDAILVETTGLADPAPMAFTFFANPWVAARFKLDSILCVMDARYTYKNMESMVPDDHLVNEAVQQLAFADLILLNKIDLVSEEELAKVKKTVQRINSTAVKIECQLTKEEEDGCPPLDKIFGIDSFSLERARLVDPDFLSSDSDTETSGPDGFEEEEEEAGPTKEHSNEGVDVGGIAGNKRPAGETLDILEEHRQPKRRRKLMHDTMGICSVGITAKGALHEWRFNMFMRDFFSEKHKDIFRSKGVLCIKGHEKKKFVFQGVHDTITYGPTPHPWREDEEQLNQIVFVGRNLNRKELIDAFRTCIWTPLPPGWTEHHDKGAKSPYYRHESGIRQKEMPVIMCPRVVSTDVVRAEQPRELLPKKPINSLQQEMSMPACGGEENKEGGLR